MNERITSLAVAKIRSIKHGDTTDIPSNSRIVFVNYSQEQIKKLRGRIDMAKSKVTISQSSEILIRSQELADLDTEFVNTWIRDYCCTMSHGIAFFSKPVYLNRHSVLSNHRFNDVWIEDGCTSIKTKKVFLFSSSYGGDGIKISIKASKKSLEIFGVNDDKE